MPFEMSSRLRLIPGTFGDQRLFAHKLQTAFPEGRAIGAVRIDAVEQASIRKKCGIQFRQTTAAAH